MHNPQYLVHVPDGAPTDVRITLTATSHSGSSDERFPVALHLVYAEGARATSLAQGDILASSGAYDEGSVLCEARALRAGKYTLVLSTFERGRVGEYALRVASSRHVALAQIPQEGSGMYSRALRGAWRKGPTLATTTAVGGPSHGRYAQNPKFLLRLHKAGTFLARLQLEESSSTIGADGANHPGAAALRPALNLSLFLVASPSPPSSSSSSTDPSAGAGMSGAGAGAGSTVGLGRSARRAGRTRTRWAARRWARCGSRRATTCWSRARTRRASRRASRCRRTARRASSSRQCFLLLRERWVLIYDCVVANNMVSMMMMIECLRAGVDAVRVLWVG